MAPQYAAYQLVLKPKIIVKMTTIERRKVFKRGFDVGKNQASIYLLKFFSCRIS